MLVLGCEASTKGFPILLHILPPFDGAAADRLSLFNAMKEFAKEFYSSKAWQDCRRAYKKSVGGLCEICLKHGRYSPGEIIHHKTHLTPQNIDNPLITLNWNNLQCVCRECHAAIHGQQQGRYVVESDGNVRIME